MDFQSGGEEGVCCHPKALIVQGSTVLSYWLIHRTPVCLMLTYFIIQGSIILFWMDFKPILIYPKLWFKIKTLWTIASSKSSRLIQRTLETLPCQKHKDSERIQRQWHRCPFILMETIVTFLSLSPSFPFPLLFPFLPLSFLPSFLFFMVLGGMKQVLHIPGKWKSGLLHPLMDGPPFPDPGYCRLDHTNLPHAQNQSWKASVLDYK